MNTSLCHLSKIDKCDELVDIVILLCSDQKKIDSFIFFRIYLFDSEVTVS